MWRFGVLLITAIYMVYLITAINDNKYHLSTNFKLAWSEGWLSYLQLFIVISILIYAGINKKGDQKRKIFAAVGLVLTTSLTALAGQVGLFVAPAFLILLVWMYSAGYIL
tara:strand:+ start:503 stop:832 length:330 start_codon:yes stop_codon:yes gene_type:complete